MKRLLLILILTFSFQTLSKADDIRDFQIEGMSIGDSLLDFYTEDEIKSFNKKYYAGSKKYYRLINYDKNKSLKEYNNIMFGIKENDLSYILNTIVGIIPYKKNIEDCYPKKKNIDYDLSLSLELTGESYVYDYQNNGGKSNVTDYKISDGFIRTWCTDYSKKREANNMTDHFGLSLTPSYYMDWLSNEAYK
ncbi:hypothetical protein OAS12_01585 [Candidatus Pelagibacter ubique]|nr:hypothetical protein [Candidatus Pelagibacter ubique]